MLQYHTAMQVHAEAPVSPGPCYELDRVPTSRCQWQCDRAVCQPFHRRRG
jgi:hypothetical protein